MMPKFYASINKTSYVLDGALDVDVDLLEGGEREKALDELKHYNPLCSFPSLVIDGTVVSVSRPLGVEEITALLEAECAKIKDA